MLEVLQCQRSVFSIGRKIFTLHFGIRRKTLASLISNTNKRNIVSSLDLALVTGMKVQLTLRDKFSDNLLC
jgi:hypothetical protein